MILKEEQFRAFLDAHENLRMKKADVENARTQVQNIQQHFAGELNSPDIEVSLKAYKNTLTEMEASLQKLQQDYQPVEEGMKKSLKSTNGAPLIWRNISGTTIYTFSIVLENGKLEIKTSEETFNP